MMPRPRNKPATLFGIRMAKIKELEKTLNVLDGICPKIGDAAYEKRVQTLATSLPNNSESFSKDLEPIVLPESSSDDDFDEKNKENSTSGNNHDHRSDEEDADDNSTGD